MGSTVISRIYIILLLVFFAAPAAYANVVVLNGLTHENQAMPGETYSGAIQIQNTGKTEKEVMVYQRDYWFNYKGESRHDEGGTLPRSNASWISYNPELLKLAPGETASISFEVKIPGADSLNGTYWSVIMVEGIAEPDTTGRARGVTINTAIRYAVQIITNIGNTGKVDLQFAGLQLTKRNETAVVDVVLENTGGRILRPEMSLELYDQQGNSVKTVKADSKKMFPGTSVTIELVLDGVEPGNYTGVLVADCDNDNIFGTNLSLEIG